MEYKTDKPIYQQIVQHICERILQNVWKPGERVPSVREMSVALFVNPNTIVRSYEILQENHIIYNKRGIGYFVEDEAMERIKNIYKKEFLEEVLPEVFKKMQLLEMEWEELVSEYKKYIKTHETN